MDEIISRTRWFRRRHVELHVSDSGVAVVSRSLFPGWTESTELLPWDEPNYGIDERWARMFPYAQEVRPGQSVDVEVRVLNHSRGPHAFRITPHVPAGFNVRPTRAEVTVASRQEKSVAFQVTADSAAAGSVAVMTADVAFDCWDLRRWCEAMLQVQSR